MPTKIYFFSILHCSSSRNSTELTMRDIKSLIRVFILQNKIKNRLFYHHCFLTDASVFIPRFEMSDVSKENAAAKIQMVAMARSLRSTLISHAYLL